MKLNPKCGVVEKGRVVQRREKGKVFRLRNDDEKEIGVYRVDGCLIDDGSIRCDFLFLVDPKASTSLFLVELKGTDHVHALRQIITAAERLQIGKFPGKKISVIVGSPSPKAATTYQNEFVKLQKRFKALQLSAPIRKNDILEMAV